jgi:acetyl esterase/lipase
MLDAAMGTASLRSADAGMASCKRADGWHQYLGTACDAGHPYAAPAAVTRLAGLAPALLLTACDDPMRDEGRAYAARLREAGVPVSEAMLSCATGWPDTLSGVAGAPAPWTDDVLKQLFTFLVATPAGSIVRTAEQGAD